MSDADADADGNPPRNVDPGRRRIGVAAKGAGATESNPHAGTNPDADCGADGHAVT